MNNSVFAYKVDPSNPAHNVDPTCPLAALSLDITDHLILDTVLEHERSDNPARLIDIMGVLFSFKGCINRLDENGKLKPVESFTRERINKLLLSNFLRTVNQQQLNNEEMDEDGINWDYDMLQSYRIRLPAQYQHVFMSEKSPNEESTSLDKYCLCKLRKHTTKLKKGLRDLQKLRDLYHEMNQVVEERRRLANEEELITQRLRELWNKE